MLSMRAWTHGWDIYAPRKNWISHQYRPGRMGLPKVSIFYMTNYFVLSL